MRFQQMRFPALLLGVALLSGCGASYSGVQAVAPAPQEQLVGTAPGSGTFTLYRASGFTENFDTHIEPIWTVSVTEGQKVGFRWVTDQAQRWDRYGAFHLVAFAGGQSRDLGAIQKRDLKYVWAGSNGDVAGYFHAKGMGDAAAAATMN